MKNTLRVTFILLVLAVTGSTAKTPFGGPGPVPDCGPTGCQPG